MCSVLNAHVCNVCMFAFCVCMCVSGKEFGRLSGTVGGLVRGPWGKGQRGVR